MYPIGRTTAPIITCLSSAMLQQCYSNKVHQLYFKTNQSLFSTLEIRWVKRILCLICSIKKYLFCQQDRTNTLNLRCNNIKHYVISCVAVVIHFTAATTIHCVKALFIRFRLGKKYFIIRFASLFIIQLSNLLCNLWFTKNTYKPFNFNP